MNPWHSFSTAWILARIAYYEEYCFRAARNPNTEYGNRSQYNKTMDDIYSLTRALDGRGDVAAVRAWMSRTNDAV